MSSRYKENAVILVAEDDPRSLIVIRETFAQALPSIQICAVSSAAQVMDFVRRDAAGGRPDLILLDIPFRNVLKALRDLKGDENFSSIPIAVLTASRAQRDEQRCYALHAHAYIIKPADPDGFASVIHEIITWFLGLITLPEPS